jgi:hypothetical protein
VAMGTRLSRLAAHGAVPPAHDARTVRELKTWAHVVTACALCDMSGRSGGVGHALAQP